MSVDNTICILESRGGDGHPEFRVADVTNLELATWQMDLETRDNYLLSEFGRCVVFRNRSKARDAAFEMIRQVGYVEYGIKEVNMEDPFPKVTEAFTWRMRGVETSKPKPRRRRPSRFQRRIRSLTRTVTELRGQLDAAHQELDKIGATALAVDEIKRVLKTYGC